MLLNPSSAAPLIGASGAIAAILGAYFVLYPRSQVLTAVFLILYLDVIEVPAVIFLGVWLVMQLAAGLASMGAGAADGGMAIGAHLTGFAVGLVTGVVSEAAAENPGMERIACPDASTQRQAPVSKCNRRRRRGESLQCAGGRSAAFGGLRPPTRQLGKGYSPSPLLLLTLLQAITSTGITTPTNRLLSRQRTSGSISASVSSGFWP